MTGLIRLIVTALSPPSEGVRNNSRKRELNVSKLQQSKLLHKAAPERTELRRACAQGICTLLIQQSLHRSTLIKEKPDLETDMHLGVTFILCHYKHYYKSPSNINNEA